MRHSRAPLAAVVAVVAVLAGVWGGSVAAQSTERAMARYRVYAAALAAIESDYVEPIDKLCATPKVCGTEALIYGSIDGMLHTLDPHSSFFTPAEFAAMRERQEGRYFGIGISIVKVADDVTVTSLFEGSPAYRAGIRRGDIIARVGAEEAKGWTTEDVVKRVKGPKGTTIDLSMRRPGVEALIPLTVERDEIKIATVRTAFMIAPGTGYIRLQDFSETTNTELGEALSSLKGQGMTRLMLDIRDNPGGPLDQAIAVANRFLKRGQMIVYTRGRIQNSDDDYRASQQGGYTDIPLVVLANRGSASASEIVTGSMQDHDRGLIVGETTFGKALVQSVYPISNNAGLALTTGRYYTPSGRMIQRPWDGSFDEYLTYSQRDQNGSRTHAPAELKYTDGGRKVYGGGGIEPDHFLPGPVEGFNPTRFSRLLRDRQVFAGFAERFTREGDERPGSKSGIKAHKVAQGWRVSDDMLSEFRAYLTDLHVRIDDAAFKSDQEFMKAMIRFEVDVDLFGIAEARRNLSKVDPQVQAALGYFDEAAQLLQLPPKK
ncbi:MAG: S41 family peptidase [Vicinamibacterales bacterium]